MNIVEHTDWSRVCWDVHIDICSNGRTHSEQQVRWSGNTDGERSLCRTNGDVHHSVHWSHLRCTSQPIPHHCLCGLSPFPMGTCPRLRCRTSLCLHLCLLCTQVCVSPFPLWWGHCPFCWHWPGFCNRVHDHFHSLVCRHCCCHRYSCGELFHYSLALTTPLLAAIHHQIN